MNDYIILTFPRCGSNYLQQLIRQKLRDPNDLKLQIDIPKTHSIAEAEGKKIITIIRDPHETMKSYTTLAVSFPKKFPLEPGQTWRFPAQDYIDLYEYILKSQAIIIDYRDLVSRPDDVLEALAKSMSLVVNNEKYVNYLFDSEDHIVSSSTTRIYHTIQYKPHFPTNFSKMFECVNWYRGSLDRAIKLH
jgi:hypothetical protein